MNPPVLKSLKTTVAVTAAALTMGALAATPSVAATAPAVQKAPSAAAYHAHKHGKVIARSGVNIRSHPTTHSSILGGYPHGAIIKIKCKVIGENVQGNNRWYKLAYQPGWVSARWVKNLEHIPWCHH